MIKRWFKIEHLGFTVGFRVDFYTRSFNPLPTVVPTISYFYVGYHSVFPFLPYPLRAEY